MVRLLPPDFGFLELNCLLRQSGISIAKKVAKITKLWRYNLSLSNVLSLGQLELPDTVPQMSQIFRKRFPRLWSIYLTARAATPGNETTYDIHGWLLRDLSLSGE